MKKDEEIGILIETAHNARCIPARLTTDSYSFGFDIKYNFKNIWMLATTTGQNRVNPIGPQGNVDATFAIAIYLLVIYSIDWNIVLTIFAIL